jgi:acyl-CoA oxidase
MVVVVCILGITAEGDNAVLMQKVSKELLSLFQSGSLQLENVTLPANNALESSLSAIDTRILRALIQVRFNRQLEELGTVLQSEMASGKDLFSVWMQQQSDLIQSVARAFAEKVNKTYSNVCCYLEHKMIEMLTLRWLSSNS